jgi:alginate O-acetyltransferase complex protein AlgJ
MNSELPRARWIALIFAAGTIILAPQAFRFVPLPPVALTENRVLASPPKLPTDFPSLHTFFQKLNDYLQDSFPLRGQAIGGLNFVRYLAGYSSLSKVVAGKDGWLFYDDGSHMAQGRGTLRYSPEVLAEWMRGLEQRLEYARQRGGSYYVLPAPHQETIYPEKLPDWLPAEPTTDVDQILEAARAKGIDQIVDARPALVAAKASRAVYGPFDIHWNGNGAYIAYRALMGRISRDYPDLAPLPQSNFKSRMAELDGLARMLGIGNFVENEQPTYATSPIHDAKRTTFLTARKDWAAPQILETNSASGRTLLLIRDSFSNELVTLLKPHFQKMIVVHVDDDGSFRKDLIERYRPDITVVESMSNSLRFRMKADAE